MERLAFLVLIAAGTVGPLVTDVLAGVENSTSQVAGGDGGILGVGTAAVAVGALIWALKYLLTQNTESRKEYAELMRDHLDRLEKISNTITGIRDEVSEARKDVKDARDIVNACKNRQEKE
jgi:hypothetical protein